MAFAGKWMELENIMLSEVSQFQNTKGLKVFSDKWMLKHNGGGWLREEWRNVGLCRGK